jgi:hypothetical protein
MSSQNKSLKKTVVTIPVLPKTIGALPQTIFLEVWI